MLTQKQQTESFRNLHKQGDPIVLFNIWDAGSATAVCKGGAKALATGSAPVAMAQGFSDGENMPFEMALANIERIIAAVDVPVSMDLEGCYGKEPTIIENTVDKAVAAVIAGFNFEDQIVGGDGLYTVDEQIKRIAAARKAAGSGSTSAFINARTDIFLKAKAETHNEAMLVDAIERARAYEQAGADGFFAPGLADEKMIERLCKEVNLPVNIIALPNVPKKPVLIKLGVSRISYGPIPYLKLMKSLTESASEAFA